MTQRRTPVWTSLALLLGLGGAVLGTSALVASGCATLGTKGGEAEGLPHNGTGPFRDLTIEETGVRPRGAAMALSGVTVDTAMIALDGSLFYASAAFVPQPRIDGGVAPDAGGVDAGAADAGGSSVQFAAPDWSLHMPRTISRSVPRPAATGQTHVTQSPGFDAGTEILAADAAWEGGYVSDPWALLADDGSVRLYYAAAGGIGVATASSVTGPYTRTGAPIVAASGSTTPRRPSVVDTRLLTGAAHAYLMYYEEDGAILAAGSSDGLSFTPLGAVTLPAMPPRDDRDATEIEVGGPGALVVTSPAERSFVRLYYESRRDNGNTLITLAAAADGMSFEAFGRPVVDERDRRFPSAYRVDERISLLYQWDPSGTGTAQGSVFVGIAPGGVTLATPEM